MIKTHAKLCISFQVLYKIQVVVDISKRLVPTSAKLADNYRIYIYSIYGLMGRLATCSNSKIFLTGASK
jgi:hypothetical protein